MENTELNTVEIPQASPPQRPPSVLILSIFLVTALLFGVGGYWLGSQRASEPTTAIVTTTLPSPTPQPSSTPDTKSELISSMDEKVFPDCKTTFSLPPRLTGAMEPYWQAPRGTVYPNLLALINPEIAQSNAKQFVAMYTTDDAASGQVDAAVSVSCVNFRMNITLNNEIVNMVTRGVAAYNGKTDGKGMGPETYTLSHSTVTKWGREVDMVKLNNDVYYTFIGNGTTGVYEVRAFGTTQDPKVIEQRQQILDSLRFE